MKHNRMHRMKKEETNTFKHFIFRLNVDDKLNVQYKELHTEKRRDGQAIICKK
jgi:hypothetical protein